MWAVWWRVCAGLRQGWRVPVALTLVTALMGGVVLLRWRGRAGLIRPFPVSCSTRAQLRQVEAGVVLTGEQQHRLPRSFC